MERTEPRRSWLPGRLAPAPYLGLPFETFGDLEQHGLEIEVTCQKCVRKRVIDHRNESLRDWRVAGTRFRCTTVLHGGVPCVGIGLLSIGKERRWMHRLAELCRRPRTPEAMNRRPDCTMRTKSPIVSSEKWAYGWRIVGLRP